MLDDDDTWFPTKIETQVKSMLKEPQSQLSATDAVVDSTPWGMQVSIIVCGNPCNRSFHTMMLVAGRGTASVQW